MTDPARPDITHPAAGRSLLAEACEAWRSGTWPRLTALADRPLAQDPAAGRAAALIAVGLAQTGRLDAARRHIRLAQERDCPPQFLAQLLVSSAYNSLGRAALLSGNQDEAIRYFETSVTAVGTTGEIRQATKRRLDEERARTARDLAPGHHRNEALEAFRTRLPDWQVERDLPYLIETKSLPRSGLHFLRSCFETALPDRFSFCEWYQEPGCCRLHPCAISQIALRSDNCRSHAVRMVKSHDFEMTDRAYPPPPGILRLILIRDPLMILTSWWALAELERHAEILLQHGLDIRKIQYLHEKPLLEDAYRIIGVHFRPLPPASLSRWLERKSAYVLTFLNKWRADPGSQQWILRYEDLPDFVGGFLETRKPSLSQEEQQKVSQLKSGKLSEFSPRSDPFTSPVLQIRETFDEYRPMFLKFADRIRAQYPDSPSAMSPA